MAATSFQAALSFTLTAEGGYVDDPAGGPTNKGVTLDTLQSYQHGATVADLKALTDAMAGMIYHHDYWWPVKGDKLPVGIDLSVFDMAVNAGVHASVVLLQKILAVAEDGDVGPITIAAATAADETWVVNELAWYQLLYYQELADWDEFGDGWTNRTEARQKAALSLIS